MISAQTLKLTSCNVARKQVCKGTSFVVCTDCCNLELIRYVWRESSNEYGSAGCVQDYLDLTTPTIFNSVANIGAILAS